MAATVLVRRFTGAALAAANAGTATTETTIAEGANTRFSMSDNPYTTETTFPVPVPASGTTYSWWMTLGLKISAAPSGVLNNQQVWFATTGALATGVTLAGAEISYTPATSGYHQATGSTTQGTQLTVGNYATVNGSVNADITNAASGWTAAAKKSLGGQFSSGDTVGSSAGVAGRGTLNYVAMQLQVGSTAGAGTLTARTLNLSYDET